MGTASGHRLRGVLLLVGIGIALAIRKGGASLDRTSPVRDMAATGGIATRDSRVPAGAGADLAGSAPRRYSRCHGTNSLQAQQERSVTVDEVRATAPGAPS